MPLVVIHGDDAVELAALARTNSVSLGSGPVDVDAGGSGAVDRRRDDVALLVAEQAAVAGVGIEGRDARRGASGQSLRSRACEQVDLFEHRRRRDMAQRRRAGPCGE